MKRSPIILIAVAVLVLISAGIYWSYQRPSTNEQSPREVTIAQAGDFFLYAPLYVAVDADLFGQRGVKVNLVSTGGDEKTWAAVVSRDASFGVADPTFIAISAQRGLEGRIVASIVNGVPFWGITFREGIAPIREASGLSGYTVATFPSPSTAYTLQKKMFQEADLQPAIREGAFGTLLPMLRSGDADIALELEPNVSQAVKEGAHVVYSLADVYGDFAITGLATLPSTVEEDPELVQNVCCALQLALDYIRRSPADSLAILRKRFPEIAPEVAADALGRVVEANIVPQTIGVEATAWRKAVNLRAEVGDLELSSDPDRFINNTAARWAMAAKECRLP